MFPITLAIAALAFLATSTTAAPPMESPSYSVRPYPEVPHATASGMSPWETLPSAHIPTVTTRLTGAPSPYTHPTAPEMETFSKSTASFTESAYGTSGVATTTGGPASHRQPHVRPAVPFLTNPSLVLTSNPKPTTFTTSHSEYSSFGGASHHLPEGAPTIAMPTFPAKDLAEAAAEAPAPADDAIVADNGILIDPLGFIHVAKDGVERSYAENGTVIDYRRLSNDQLTRMAATLSTVMQDVWKDVDGNDVTSDSQIFNPPPALRPTAPTAEGLQQSVNEVAAMKKLLEGRTVGPAIGYPTTPPLCTTLSCYKHQTCRMFGCSWCWITVSNNKGKCKVFA
ncbi:hypothetical protein LTR91_004854 [Friedmanniomyces endolithicus]|uniref:Uncharacterized protein n=1 Tax=Friedmanniomyces endolithicus TaxID=329885 RepID=A0AAN6KWN1_9PEZI|nr:hypothetical protein LTS00_015321 [Friedmanniomyces endolithicus]KAK0285257.1 hypothetical protein LTR35_005459 [Friedmanniomyces endolithicus]KAK0326833.1 hypothetical protein LTR82_001593 [Friedmanniomyces endolithicus]KAK0926370.1 hypothetical protein LTR57_004227 [Friedmanniomyces endolithicus]KAK1003063.1 hypothetical protein LTR91_004854 [Friedmanniomyces endolithicus]